MPKPKNAPAILILFLFTGCQGPLQPTPKKVSVPLPPPVTLVKRPLQSPAKTTDLLYLSFSTEYVPVTVWQSTNLFGWSMLGKFTNSPVTVTNNGFRAFFKFTREYGSVSLVWDGSNVDAYGVYWGVQSRNYTNTFTTTATTATVTNLKAGVTYYFAATCIKSGLESDYSNECQYTMPTNQPGKISASR